MNQKVKITAFLLIIGAVASFGWWAYHDYQQRQALKLFGIIFSSPPEARSWRKALPSSAQDIQEWGQAEGLLPDYSYILKARMPLKDFRGFIEAQGLTPHEPDRKYTEDSGWLSWNQVPGFEGLWWDPTDSLEDTFVSERNDTWTYAKYENGYLYFKSINH